MMQKRNRISGTVLLLMGMALWICKSTHTAEAQAIYGSIYGTVTDSTGAAIPNATITVSDESKGTSVQVTSNQSGEYTVPNLIPDVYDIKADAAGFSAVENHGIQVSADTSPKVDLKLSCRQRHRKRYRDFRSPTAPNRSRGRRDRLQPENHFRPAHRGAQLCQPSTADSGGPGDGMDAKQRRGLAGQPDR